MSLQKDDRTVAATIALVAALDMSDAEFATLGLRKSSTAASDADVIDMEFVDMAVALAQKRLPHPEHGFEFNVGKLSKIIFKIDPETFPTIPSAHSKLMSAARWLKNNRAYTMPIKAGAERTTIAYPPAPATA